MKDGMNALYHTWEMGQRSWRQLSEMLLVAEKVTVWGPSYEQILDARENYGMPYTPDQFLELVRQGFIKVAARPNWYDPSERQRLQEDGYVMTTWHDAFDGEIAKIQEEDLVELIDAPEVDGWVQTQIDEQGRCFLNAQARIRNGQYPTDWHRVAVRKLKGVATEEGLVRIALRTARHHLKAAEKLECNAAVEDLGDAGFFAQMDAYPLSTHIVDPDSPRMRFEELIYHLSKVKFEKMPDKLAFDNHIKMLHELKGIKPYLQDVTGSSIDLETDVLMRLRQKIKEALPVGPDNFELSMEIAFAACAIITGFEALEAMSRRNFLRRTLTVAAAVGGAIGASKAAVMGGFQRAAIEPEVVVEGHQQRAMLLALAGPNVLEKIPVSTAQTLLDEVERIKGALPFYNQGSSTH